MCEWTAGCGSVGGADCSNKCIGSIDFMASAVPVAGGAVVSYGLLYCHLIATTMTRTYNVLQGKEDATDSSARAAPGCPSDAVIASVADSDAFATMISAGVSTGKSDVSRGTDLFGFLRAQLLL